MWTSSVPQVKEVPTEDTENINDNYGFWVQTGNENVKEVPTKLHSVGRRVRLNGITFHIKFKLPQFWVNENMFITY